MKRGTKTRGTDTETTGRPRGRVGVEAGRGSTGAGERRRAGKESAATTETGKEMENSVLTNEVVAKSEAIISESPAMTIVDIVNAEGVIALSKCPPAAIFSYILFLSF